MSAGRAERIAALHIVAVDLVALAYTVVVAESFVKGAVPPEK